MGACGVALDVESHRIQPGLLAPPLVCGSAAWLTPHGMVGELLSKDVALDVFAGTVDDPGAILVGANIAFDLLVLAKELGKLGVDVMPNIFDALENDRIYDLQIAEALHAIAGGHLGKDPRTGGDLINPETGRRGRYSLSMCVDLVLGRQDAKANDEWRERYAELEKVPMDEWPVTARDYPVDDARNTIETALAQTGHLGKRVPHHRWGANDACLDCGATSVTTPCTVRRAHRNLHDLSAQVGTAFAMHLGAAWGFRVNQSAVDVIERHALRNKERGITPFIESGLVRADGSENRSELKRRVAIAYGAKDPCPTCTGTGKVPSPAAKPVQCKTCRGRSAPWKWGGEIKAPTVASCSTCKNTGLVPNPKPPLINCCIIRDPGTEQEVREKTCDGTGLLIIEDVPRSEKDGIGYGRDVLHESGEEFLMSYGDYQEDAKDLTVYVPYLRRARVALSEIVEVPDDYVLQEGESKC